LLPAFPRSQAKSREADMRKWAKPRIVEIAIGLEINSYASAEID
jgi:coenzyme PQQ precursor peptide PqqA